MLSPEWCIMRDYPSDMPWVIVELNRQRFALPSAEVREIIPLSDTAFIPQLPERMRGVLNIRGRVLPVLDLRVRLGMQARPEEVARFCEMMQQREEDHRRWLAELSLALNERRPFNLTLDPHKCAFGRWYDVYRSPDPWVAGMLGKFDAPHRAIHQHGAEIEQLKQEGAFDRARRRMEERASSLLTAMVKLFAELRQLVTHVSRELAVILTGPNGLFAATIDAAVSVEKLGAGGIELIPVGDASNRSGACHRLAKGADGTPVLLLEVDQLLAASAG